MGVGTELSAQLFSVLDGPEDTTSHVGHGTGATRAKDLDGNELSLLGDTVLARANGTGTVSAVAVAVLVDVVLRHGLTPSSTALELNVVDVDTSVNDVGGNTLTTVTLVDVLVEGAQAKTLAVRDTSQTPRSSLLDIVGIELASVHDSRSGVSEVGVVVDVPNLILGLRHDLDGNKGVHLDVVDLGLSTDVVKDIIGELAGITLEMTLEVVHMPDTVGALAVEAVGGELSRRDEALVSKEIAGADTVLEDDHIGARDGLELRVCGERSKLS